MTSTFSAKLLNTYIKCHFTKNICTSVQHKHTLVIKLQQDHTLTLRRHRRELNLPPYQDKLTRPATEASWQTVSDYHQHEHPGIST